MAQQYWSTDYWSADYWSVDYWLPSNSADITGTVATTLADFIAGTDSNESQYWSVDWWSTDYWPQGYWGAPHTGWVGTFYIPASINGTIQRTLDDFASALVGSVVQVDYFDVTVNLGVTWTETEFFAFNATIAPTLDDITSSLQGTASSVGGVVGSIGASLADSTSAFTGTFVAPANRTGTMAPTLADITSSMTGGSFSAGSALGNLTATLDAFTGSMVGAHVVPTYTLTWASMLDDVTADNWVGASYTGGVSLFKLETTLDDFECQIFATEDHDFKVIESTRDAVNIRTQRVGSAPKTRIGGRRKVKA